MVLLIILELNKNKNKFCWFHDSKVIESKSFLGYNNLKSKDIIVLYYETLF